ncbi:MAG: alpha-amylase family glycosyl hydrolase, partial [Clostridia bacterium]
MIYNSRYTFYKTPFGAVSTREQVKIRFPLDAWISVSEVYFVLRKNDISTYYPMKWSENTSGSNIYEVFVECIEAGIYFYRFEMRNNDGVWYYGRDEFCNAVCGENLPEWQITVYNDDYKTPDFVKGGVIYHIFVDRFNKAGNIKTERKYRLHDNWFDEPIVVDRDGKYQADDFFGGNFLGIIEKLSYLYDLGVTTIYLSPIFKSFSNHRYDTGDYMQIDELIGSENDFKNLIDKAAEIGIS